MCAIFKGRLRVQGILILILFILVGVLVLPKRVIASSTYKIDNNGNIKKNPYGKNDSIPSSYEGLEYYDCYLPYAKKVKEIGGICTSGLRDVQNGNWHNPMPEANQNYFVGDYVNWEMDDTEPYKGLSVSHETDTGCSIYTDDNGNKYYAMAVQHFFSPDGKGYYSWSTENRTQLIDVILTDGTVVHFILRDANGDNDTNGWENGASSGNDRVLNTLKYPQYRNLFSSIAGNCIEIWGTQGKSTSGFSTKYNLHVSGEGVHVAYYRMYHARASEGGIKRTAKAGKEAAYSLGGKVIVTDTAGDEGSPEASQQETDENGNPVSNSSNGKTKVDRVPPENELVGMRGLLDKLSKNASNIDLPNAKDLTGQERQSIETIKENSKIALEQKITGIIRALISLIGILLMLYIVLLWVAYMFDRVNTVFEFSMLSLLTFGKLNLSLEGHNDNVFKSLIKISVVLFLVSVLILSGLVYGLIQRVFNLGKDILI